MNLFEEIELKLRLPDPSVYDSLIADSFLADLRVPESCRESICSSTYYDTPDRRLLTNGLALRVRDTGSGTVATVKDSGTVSNGLYVRGEWNKNIESGTVSPDIFSDMPIGPKLSGLVGAQALEPLCQTQFKRVTMDFPTGDGRIEFAADLGSISAGKRSEPLCEVELELKSGRASELMALGASLAERYSMTIEEQSKFERGLLLAGLSAGQERPKKFRPSVDQPVRTVMTENIIDMLHGVFDAQELLITNPDNPESAHQYRVSLRKLRALLSFAKPVADEKKYSALQQALKALADDYTYRRELDVLLEKWRLIRTVQTEETGLSAVLFAERQKEIDRCRAAAMSRPATKTLLTIWGAAMDTLWTEKANAHFSKFGPKHFNKWEKAFKGDLKKETFQDWSNIHKLRIKAKKIRYVQDTLISPGKHGKFSASALKRYQALLGALCDSGRNIQILSDLSGRYGKPLVRHESRQLIDNQLREMDNLTEEIQKEIRRL